MRLRMEKAIYGGNGLGRAPADATELAGKAVFVPMALPGELVEANIVSNRRGYITAKLDALLEPSTQRVQPGCEYYERCGGCHYQHADYSAQLEMKRSILLEMLARAHVGAPDELRTLAGDPWRYRNRIRLHVQQQPAPALCYRQAASHRDLPVDHCPVAAPTLQQAIPVITAALDAHRALARSLTEVELFTNHDESSLLLSLFSERPLKREALQRFAEALLPELSTLKGIRATGPEDRTATALNPSSWGETSLDYAVPGRIYRVSAGAFFQINRFVIPALLDEVVAARSGALAWDLYAGVGLFAQALAQRFARVVAVESAPQASADLRHNLQHGNEGMRECVSRECVVTDTLRFLRSYSAAKRQQPSPDLVVVDPPRAGLGAEVCTLVAAAQPTQIVYVSCDPSTLARDLRALQPSGYRLARLTLVDLFPQTFHLETVAVLERA